MNPSGHPGTVVGLPAPRTVSGYRGQDINAEVSTSFTNQSLNLNKQFNKMPHSLYEDRLSNRPTQTSLDTIKEEEDNHATFESSGLPYCTTTQAMEDSILPQPDSARLVGLDQSHPRTDHSIRQFTHFEQEVQRGVRETMRVSILNATHDLECEIVAMETQIRDLNCRLWKTSTLLGRIRAAGECVGLVNRQTDYWHDAIHQSAEADRSSHRSIFRA